MASFLPHLRKCLSNCIGRMVAQEVRETALTRKKSEEYTSVPKLVSDMYLTKLLRPMKMAREALKRGRDGRQTMYHSFSTLSVHT